MALHVSPKARRAAELLVAVKAVACDPPRVDVRRLHSAVDERRELVWLLAEAVRDQAFDAVAGGGPFAAWVAELAGLPLGGGAGQKVLLVEDLDALQALRGAGAVCEHAAVVFHDGRALEGITLHALTTWPHVIDAADIFRLFSPDQIQGLRAATRVQ